jgi:hypothetical protein
MHEAVNEGAGGEVGVIVVVSDSDSGLSSVAEGTDMCRKSEGDGENEGKRGSEEC